MLNLEDVQLNKMNKLLIDVGYEGADGDLINVFDFFYKTLKGKYVVGNRDLEKLEQIDKILRYTIGKDNCKNYAPFIFIKLEKSVSSVSELAWSLSGQLYEIFNEETRIVFSTGKNILITYSSLKDVSNKKSLVIYLSDFFDLCDKCDYETILNCILNGACVSMSNFMFYLAREYYAIGKRSEVYNSVVNTEIMFLEEYPWSIKKEMINDRADEYINQLTIEKYGDEYFPNTYFYTDIDLPENRRVDLDMLEYEIDIKKESDREEILYDIDNNEIYYLNENIFESADTLVEWIESGSRVYKNDLVELLSVIQVRYLFHVFNNNSIEEILSLDKQFNCNYRVIVNEINHISNKVYGLDILEYESDYPFIIFDYVDLIESQFEKYNIVY